MDFTVSEKAQKYKDRVKAFMEKHVYPIEHEVYRFYTENQGLLHPSLEKLKKLARDEGLWNLFLGPAYTPYSPGLLNVEYATVAEEMGKVPWASEVFNCSAPDTGNMELLAKYGDENQKKSFLEPLLSGDCRSAFLMTEPDVASSDARNIATSMHLEGDHYILNGKKWWSTNAMHPLCRFYIIMAKSKPDNEAYNQQSMIIAEADTPGLSIKRSLPVMNLYDRPGEHCEIHLEKVKVHKEMLIAGEGRGFEMAQGRLGPGRIHHCMRLIGQASRALDYMCRRANERTIFGKNMKDFSSIRQEIAQSYCDIEQARLLTLKAADAIDKGGLTSAKELISAIKIVAPSMACRVIDRAIQILGGKGMSQDTPLVYFYTIARALRLADGPDEVHMYQLGRNLIKQHLSNVDAQTPYFDENQKD